MPTYGKPRQKYGTNSKKRVRTKPELRQMATYPWCFRETVEQLMQELEKWDELPTQASKSEFSVFFCDEDSKHRPHGYTIDSLAKAMREYLQAARTSNRSRYRTTLEYREQRWEISVSVKQTAYGSYGVWIDGKPKVNMEGLKARIQQQLDTQEDD